MQCSIIEVHSRKHFVNMRSMSCVTAWIYLLGNLRSSSPADSDNKSWNLVQATWYVFSYFVEISFKSPNCVPAVVPQHWKVLKTVSVWAIILSQRKLISLFHTFRFLIEQKKTQIFILALSISAYSVNCHVVLCQRTFFNELYLRQWGIEW